MNKHALIYTLALCTFNASFAQTATQTATQTKPKPPSSGPHITVFLRERTNATQWFAAAAPAEVYGHQDSLLRFGITQREGRFEYLLELTQPSEFALPTDAVSPVSAQGQLGLGGTYYAANGNNRFPAALALKQGFARLYFNPAKSNFRFGRFEFFEGQETTPPDPTMLWLQNNRVGQHLIGNFGFTSAQRSFDGVQARAGGDNWDLTFMGARAVQGVFNMNANPEINVDTQYLAYTRYLANKHVLARGFALGYHDGRTQITKTDNRPLSVRAADHQDIRIGTFGGSMIAVVPAGAGAFDAVLWGAVQNGQWGQLAHRAGAFTAEAGYRSALSWKPWLRAGIWRSTGDSNNADGTHNTFFQVLPTPRVYGRMPFFNLMNLTDKFVQVIADPSPKLELRSDLHGLNLTQASDLWYGGGGAFDNSAFGFTGRPGTTRGRSLASFPDISADYKFNPTLSIGVYYAHAFGRSTVSSIYPVTTGSNYGFLELTYKLDKPLRGK